MSAPPCIPLNLLLTEAEFGVLTEVGEENTLSPEDVLKTSSKNMWNCGPIIRISTCSSPCVVVDASSDRHVKGRCDLSASAHAGVSPYAPGQP